MIPSTTTLTDTLPIVLVPLPSGGQAAIVYSLSFGDVTMIMLLATLLALQVVQMWRYQRSR